MLINRHEQLTAEEMCAKLVIYYIQPCRRIYERICETYRRRRRGEGLHCRLVCTLSVAYLMVTNKKVITVSGNNREEGEVTKFHTCTSFYHFQSRLRLRLQPPPPSENPGDVACKPM